MGAVGHGRTPDTASQLRRLEGHVGRVVTLAFSPDGSLLLSHSWDNFSSLWDSKSGRRLLVESRVPIIQFSEDGRELVVQGRLGGRGRVPLLDRRGFRTVLHAERLEKTAGSVAFSRDGRLAATDHVDVSRLWDAASGRELARMPGRSPLFLPDNESLLTSTDRGVIRFAVEDARSQGAVSNLLDGVPLLRRERGAPLDEFNMLSLAPDDRTLVVSMSRGGVVLLDLVGERPLRRLTNVVAHFASLSADGAWLMTQAHINRTHLISLTNESRPRFIGWHMNTAFSPDGQRLALSTEDTLTLAGRNATNAWLRTARVSLDLGVGANAHLAFSPDSRILAVNTNRFDIHLLDAVNARVLATFAAPFDPTVSAGRTVAFSADGRFLRALRQGGEVMEWDIPVVRAELAKLGLDWNEATPMNRSTDAHVRANSSEQTSGRGHPRSGRGEDSEDRSHFKTATTLPAVAAGIAALLALGAGVIVFFHQRRTLAAFTRAEALAEQQQRQLVQAQDALFQSQKMEALGTLATGVAHDFNNLLSIIRMSKQLVDRAVKPVGVTKENLAAIGQAVQEGKAIVNSMLGYSRRPVDAIEDFSVARVVGDTVALLSRQFLSGLTLNLQIDPQTPSIFGSRTRLEQVLLNLIVNASEAMKGTGTLTVSARLLDSARTTVLAPKPSNNYVEIAVSDSGPGIPAEVLPRIFEPFFTTKNAGTQRGTGLGLSMVYAIAKQDGWGLDVQNLTSQGAAFRLLLPASQTEFTGRRLPTSQDADPSGRLTTQ